MGAVTQADLDFHGILPGDSPTELLLPVVDRLCTPFGFLYGGTGISAATTIAEQVSGRPLVWITVQYVANAFPGETVRLRADVVAAGRSTTQIQVTATVPGGGEDGADRLVFSALCAHTDRPAEDHRWVGAMPDATPVDECQPFMLPFQVTDRESFLVRFERRVDPASAANVRETGHLLMWVKVPTWPGPSAAMLGHIADVVPVAVFTTFDRSPGATSLDNTIRVLDPGYTEWTLLDVEAHGINRAIGHGQVRMWSQDGRLLAVASQSAIIRNSHHQPSSG